MSYINPNTYVFLRAQNNEKISMLKNLSTLSCIGLTILLIGIVIVFNIVLFSLSLYLNVYTVMCAKFTYTLLSGKNSLVLFRISFCRSYIYYDRNNLNDKQKYNIIKYFFVLFKIWFQINIKAIVTMNFSYLDKTFYYYL